MFISFQKPHILSNLVWGMDETQGHFLGRNLTQAGKDQGTNGQMRLDFAVFYSLQRWLGMG